MKSDKENREWLDEYMSLKQVNPGNPFTVPVDYFNELEQRLGSYTKLDELKRPDALQGFTVPGNYFDELSSNIQSRIFVEEALNAHAHGLIVPDDYFNDLEQHIQSRIVVEEALTSAATGFAVPEGYFDKLNTDILNRTINQPVKKPKAKIVRMVSSAAFKYAVAACLTLFVGGAIFFNQSTPTALQLHDQSFLHKSLSGVPVDEIKSYLQLHLDDTDTRTLMDDGDKQINDDKLNNDLQEYLDTTQ